jgi:hypothetical protein
LCETQQQNWAGARGAVGVSSGCYHYTVEVLRPGIPRVGWSSASASFELGTCKNSWGYGGTGKKSHGREFLDYGGGYSKGDTIGCILQMPHGRTPGTVSFTKNNTWLGPAFTIPANFSQPLFPAVCLKGTAVKLNFTAPAPKGGKKAPEPRQTKPHAKSRVCADCGGKGSLHVDTADLCVYCAACFKRLYGATWQVYYTAYSIHHTPYTIHPTPFTLRPTSYTLHPTPYTLHHTPYTIHPIPYTIHPTPYTLHPIPYTIHPTPYTIHPTPYILHPTSYTNISADLGPCAAHWCTAKVQCAKVHCAKVPPIGEYTAW